MNAEKREEVELLLEILITNSFKASIRDVVDGHIKDTIDAIEALFPPITGAEVSRSLKWNKHGNLDYVFSNDTAENLNKLKGLI